jgi:hypothetical protein
MISRITVPLLFTGYDAVRDRSFAGVYDRR